MILSFHAILITIEVVFTPHLNYCMHTSYVVYKSITILFLAPLVTPIPLTKRRSHTCCKISDAFKSPPFSEEGTQPSDQSLNRRTTNYFVIVMKTSPLFSALLLLGFASSGLATWDWSLDNIANFKTNISVSVLEMGFLSCLTSSASQAELMQGCLGEAKANEFGEGLMQCPTSPSEAIEGNW